MRSDFTAFKQEIITAVNGMKDDGLDIGADTMTGGLQSTAMIDDARSLRDTIAHAKLLAVSLNAARDRCSVKSKLCSDLQTELEKCRLLNREQAREMIEQKKTIRILERQNEALRAALSSAADQMDSTEAELADRQQEVKKLSLAFANWNSLEDQWAKEKEDLHIKDIERQEAVEQLMVDHKLLLNELDSAQDQIESLKQYISDIEDEKDCIAEERDRFKSEMNSQRQISENRKSKDYELSDSLRMQAEVAESRRIDETKTLQLELNNQITKNGELIKNIAEMHDVLKSLEFEYEKVVTHNEVLQGRLVDHDLIRHELVIMNDENDKMNEKTKVDR
jgi:chromosome segregation ATPase